MAALGLPLRPPLRDAADCMGSTRDGIVPSRYSSLADDESQASVKREAAMLLSIAEGQLNEDMLGECMQAVSQALALFRRLGDETGVADTVSVGISCQKREAEMEKKAPTQALQTAQKEMSNFISAGNRRGEACMLLALADLYSSMQRGKKNLSKAMSCIKEALNIFKSLRDKKLEAAANVTLTSIYCQKRQPEQAMTMAAEALKLYKSLGDKKGEVKALRVKALAYSSVDDYDNAIATSRAVLSLVREIGDKGQTVGELKELARLLLEAGKAGTAVPLAQEALTTAKAVGVSKKVEANALLLVCQTLATTGNTRKAVKLAKAGLASAKEAGDAPGIGAMYEVLLYTHLQSEFADEAMAAAEEAIAAGKELGDKELEMSMLHQVCSVQMRANQFEKAAKSMRDAASLAQDLNDVEAEADALLTFCNVYIQRRDVKSDKDAIAEAMTAAEDCRALYRMAKYAVGEAQAIMTMALLKSLNEDSDAVLPLAQEARQLYQAGHDEHGEGVALRLMVEAYLADEDFPQALEHANSMVNLQRSVGVKKKLADAMVKVAQIHYVMEDSHTALQVASEAQLVAKEASDYNVEASACLLMAQINIKVMESEEGVPGALARDSRPSHIAAKEQASKAIKDAMLLAGKAHSEVLRGSALLARAEMAVATSMENEALRAGLEADKIFGKVEEFSKQVSAKIVIANVYHKMQDKSKALEMARAALKIAKESQDDPSDELRALEALQMIEGDMRTVAIPVRQIALGDALAAEVTPAKPALDKATVRRKVAELVENAALSSDPIDAEIPLMDAGVDSLATISLVREMSKEFGVVFQPSTVYNYPTASMLVDHVIEETG